MNERWAEHTEIKLLIMINSFFFRYLFFFSNILFSLLFIICSFGRFKSKVLSKLNNTLIEFICISFHCIMKDFWLFTILVSSLLSVVISCRYLVFPFHFHVAHIFYQLIITFLLNLYARQETTTKSMRHKNKRIELMDSLLTKEFVWLIVLRVIREIEREILTNIMGHDHISKDLNYKRKRM